MQLNIQGMQWSKLPHFADVRPIDQSDAACLEDIRRVLLKHGALERFGVTLLHNHFDLDDDEMMLETTDLERREHLVRPIRRAEMEAEGVTFATTVVGFDEKGTKQVCGCDPRASGHHHK